MENAELEKNLFFIAYQDKYIFKTPKGVLTVSDLFDLPVPIKKLDEDEKEISEKNSHFEITLDNIAKGLNKQIQEISGDSFVRKYRVTKKEIELKNKLEIVKLLIEYKIKKYEDSIDEKKKQDIKRLIKKKEMEEFENQSIEELKKLL